MEDDRKENTITVTQLSAAKSQLTSPQLPTSHFYILEDFINLSFHTIPLTISRLLSAVSTTSISGYGHNIFWCWCQWALNCIVFPADQSWDYDSQGFGGITLQFSSSSLLMTTEIKTWSSCQSEGSSQYHWTQVSTDSLSSDGTKCFEGGLLRFL